MTELGPHDLATAEDIGKLKASVEHLIRAVTALNARFDGYNEKMDQRFKEMNRAMLFDISKVATGIVALWAGLIELVKAML